MGNRNAHAASSHRLNTPEGLIIETTSSADGIARCMKIRMEVFVEEQKVAVSEEVDDLDEVCIHFVAQLLGTDVGTARLWQTDDGDAKAQRVAVIKKERGKGIGAALMARLEQVARDRGHKRSILGAQLDALSFYEKLGYKAFGPVFDDAGIPHRMMEKPL